MEPAVDQPKHEHGIACGCGLRVVPVSLGLLSSVLRDGCAATPVNVPRDLAVIGSMTKNDVFDATRKAYPPGVVMLLCASAEWARAGDFDQRTGKMNEFIPEYRRTA